MTDDAIRLISDLRSEMREGFRTVKEDVSGIRDELKEDIGRVEKQVGRVEQQTTKTNGRMTAVETRHAIEDEQTRARREADDRSFRNAERWLTVGCALFGGLLSTFVLHAAGVIH